MSCSCFSNNKNSKRKAEESSKARYCSLFVVLFSIFISIALLSLLLTLYIYFLDKTHSNKNDNSFSSPVCSDSNSESLANDSPLILSDYIGNGLYTEAQKLSKNTDLLSGVSSYSGYFTVNKTFNSNLFFIFFPLLNVKDFEDAPLILYLQGGPGLSSMFGLFLENGPIYLENSMFIKKRNNSWANSHHLLYIDSPVGTGFSFSDSDEAFAKGQEDVSRDLYSALIQFFMMFPKMRKCDFYITGTSYSGKYVPVLSYKIHRENLGGSFYINLKGLAIGSGYFEGSIQDNYSEFYFHLGLIDEEQKKEYEKIESEIQDFVKNREYSKARESLGVLIMTKMMNYSGFEDIYMYNALEPHTPSSALDFEEFLNKGCVKKSLHVGSRPFEFLSSEVYKKIEDSDFYYSPKSQLESLLNSNYQVLIYSSQFDLIITHTGIAKFLNSLKWHGEEEWRRSERKVWRVGEEISGYFKNYDNLNLYLLRNSGHAACSDQPLWCEDMINRFTKKSKS